MAKTVYMVASDEARDVFEDPAMRWNKITAVGSVIVDSVLDDVKKIAERDGRTLYRCEPISADEEPSSEPRKVKAYVAFDHKMEGGQDVWAYASVEQARVSCSRFPIFEIEMREVPPPAPKRETGWVVKAARDFMFGSEGFGDTNPIFFTEQTAKEFAASGYCDGTGVAIEVYRDTLEPVDAE